MKIKKIISLYLFALSLTLLGSEILDEEMIAAIEESLKNQHADPDVTEQNLEYSLLELENKLEGLRKILEEKAYIMFFDLNTKIKSAKEEEKDINKFNSIREEIKRIMNIIPHEVLEKPEINELTSFTTTWNTIQRGESKIIDIKQAEKIEKENTFKKVQTAKANINIYTTALGAVNQYIKKNNIKEDQIIDPRKERIRKEKEQADQKMQEIKNKLTRDLEEKKKEKENATALREVAKFKEEEEERNRIERENDPQLKEIQKIRKTMYKKVSDYFNKKNFETALTEAKEEYNEEAINDIQKNIELIMQYCPHEFFTEEKIQKTFPEIKKTWENAQRGHRNESKILNPTKNNKEDLEHWKNSLKKLNIHIIDSQVNTDKINKINKRLLNNLQTESFKSLRENSILEKTKHLKIGTGIGLITSIGIIGLHNNFLKQSSRKKMDLLQKALILSGSTILGGIGGKYFYQMKKYIPQKLRKDKPNKIHEK